MRLCEVAFSMYREHARDFLGRVMAAGIMPDFSGGKVSGHTGGTGAGVSGSGSSIAVETVLNRFASYKVGDGSAGPYHVDLLVSPDGQLLYRAVGDDPTVEPVVGELGGSNVLGFMGQPWPFFAPSGQDLDQWLPSLLPPEEQLREVLGPILAEMFGEALARYVPQT